MQKLKKSKMSRFYQAKKGKPFLIYQLGTNNWQREGEFAPGSGILHEAHHNAQNDTDGIRCYSIYPSPVQTPHPDPLVKVFKLNHPIPICESAHPISSYRWHSMSDDEVLEYKTRLEKEVYEQMTEAEERESTNFSLAIAHHAFLNSLVLRNVLRRRVREGKPQCPLVCFVHGTGLKMYQHEKDQILPEEFPVRFLPMIESEGVFSSWEDDGVQICYAISQQQVDAILAVFPTFPKERIMLSPNGINQQIFHPVHGASIDTILSDFSSWYYQGSKRKVAKIDGSKYNHVVVTVGRFAYGKRIEALLYAASEYEKSLPGTATVVVGTGPLGAQKQLQDLAFEELNLQRTFFIGHQSQPVLAKLYTIASIGVFPSYNEAFGMVLIECMSCGTPVIGCDSGGPRDFVDSSVGVLLQETDDIKVLGQRVRAAVETAITEDWKASKSAACQDLVDKKYSVKKQCKDLLEKTRKDLNI